LAVKATIAADCLLSLVPPSARSSVSLGLLIAYHLWPAVIALLSVLDRAFLMRLLARDHMSKVLVALSDLMGNGARYERLERDLRERVKATSRWFATRVALPTTLYVFVVLSFSQGAQEYLGGFAEHYARDLATYTQAREEGCNQTSTCSDDWDDCRSHDLRWCSSGPRYERAQSCGQCETGDCCPEDPSWLLYVVVPAALLTLVCIQLYTPVLASIMVMMNVLELHNLHVESVMLRVVGPRQCDMEVGASTEPEPELALVEGESQLHEDGCHLDLSVQEALDQFCQVKQILATTSGRWSAVLLIECAITVCIAVEPVMYATLKPDPDIGQLVHLSFNCI
jgi:hypothetical protein